MIKIYSGPILHFQSELNTLFAKSAICRPSIVSWTKERSAYISCMSIQLGDCDEPSHYGLFHLNIASFAKFLTFHSRSLCSRR